MGDLNLAIRKGLLWGSGVTIVNALIQLVVLAILARLLTPADFGLIGMGNIITAFSLLVLELGVAAAITQRETLNNEHKGSAHFIAMMMSAFVGFLIIIGREEISSFFDTSSLKEIIPAYAAIFLIRGLSIVPQGLMLRELKFKQLHLIELVSYFFGYGLFGVGVAVNGFGVWSLIMAYLAQSTIKTVLINYGTETRTQWRISKKGFSEIIAFGAGDTLGQCANFLANQLDNILIGKLLGVDALGVYGRAYQISIMPVNLMGAVIQTTLFPVFSRAQSLELTNLIIPWLRLTLFIGCYLSLTMALWAKEIVSIVLGSGWVEYSSIFRILSFGILFRLLLKFSDTLLRSQGKLYRRAIVQSLYAGGVFIGVYSFYDYGLNIVCMSILSAVVFAGCLNFFIACHSVGLKFKDILKATTAGVSAIVLNISSFSISRTFRFDDEAISLLMFCVASVLLVGVYMILVRRFSNNSATFI